MIYWAYSTAWRQGCNFFRNGQNKTEKGRKCKEICKKNKDKFSTISEKDILMRATIVHMKDLRDMPWYNINDTID